MSENDSNDTVTEVTTQGWFSRIGDAIKGILFGLLLFVAGFPLLWWNEGRSVETYKTLQEGAGAVVSVPSDRVDNANSGKLVHVSGLATTRGTLSDTEFGVSANALTLVRKVEMYQWKEESRSETEKNVGGSTTTKTTYTYQMVWSDRLISSSSFKQSEAHRNPARMPYESKTQQAANATLGAFRLTPRLVENIGGAVKLEVAALPDALAGRAILRGGEIHIGANPDAPQIGDARVSFSVVAPKEVSVVARQTGDTFEPFEAKAGGTIEMLRVGVQPASAMFKAAEQENVVLTWVLRLVGFLLMAFGIGLVLRPLVVLADVLPILGDILSVGTGLIAILVALPFALVTIALAWLVYRPLIAIPLLVAAGGCLYALWHARQRGREKRAAQTAPA